MGACIRSDLTGPLNFIRTQTTGAGVNPARGSVYQCPDTLNIGLPHPVRTPVGVRNFYAKRNTFAANITFSHFVHLLRMIVDWVENTNIRYSSRFSPLMQHPLGN